MDNIVTGAVGIAIFLLFVGGLAESIGSAPFIVIVILVAILAVIALWEDIRHDIFRNRNS